MITSLHDPNMVQNYYADFLDHVNTYQNLTRPSIYVRYYNINTLESKYEDVLKSTIDTYHESYIHFDIYDLTPIYYIAPISNSIADVPDLDGKRIDGRTSITIYTINRPKMNDIVVLTTPLKTKEIFRVVGVRPSVNMMHTDPNVTWFELDLDYAPLKTTDGLKINNHYIYDSSQEKYLTYTDYESKLNYLQKVSDLLEEIKPFFNPVSDLYIVDNLIPIYTNEIIGFFKKQYDNNYKRLFEKYLYPYGYYDLVGKNRYETFNSIPETDIRYVYDMESNQIREQLVEENLVFDNIIEKTIQLKDIVIGDING